MKKLLFIVFLMAFANANAQQWGLYTLYSVKASNKVYLVDTNGVIYKTWIFPITKKTCFSSYLIPGDTLVRTVINQDIIITGGPISGEIQKVDWNNNVTWDFLYSDSTYVSHHDICPLPNGNVLLLAIDVKTPAEAQQAGSSSVYERYSEKIIEVHQTGATSGSIVWEWKLWDHLCQDHDSTKANYVSSIVQHPRLINLNYRIGQDFMHLNGIDYNAALDQITFSSLKYNEIYVIDHGTTTAEAAGHSGGNSGHGGDILYRWGNPSAYKAPGDADFDFVHDAHWVPADNPNYPNYLCGFNNQGGVGNKSCVDIFCPPYNGYDYFVTAGATMTPANYSWRYTSTSSTVNEGSSQQLPNGNSLVCLSFKDTLLEVTNSGTILWTYDTGGPVSMAFRYSKCNVRGPVANASASATQVVSGTPVTLNSSATSVTETNPSYSYSWSSIPAGFTSSSQNPNLTPAGTATYIVTITDIALGCSDTASVTVQVPAITGTDEEYAENENIVVYPNPTTGIVNISGRQVSYICELTVLNIYGEVVERVPDATIIDFSGFARGVYFLSVKSRNSKILNFKVIY